MTFNQYVVSILEATTPEFNLGDPTKNPSADALGQDDGKDPTEIKGSDVDPMRSTDEPETPKENTEPPVTPGEIAGLRLALAALRVDPADRKTFPIRDLKIFNETDPEKILAAATRITGKRNIDIPADSTKKQMLSQLVLRALRFSPKDLPVGDETLGQTVTTSNAREIQDRLKELVGAS